MPSLEISNQRLRYASIGGDEIEANRSETLVSDGNSKTKVYAVIGIVLSSAILFVIFLLSNSNTPLLGAAPQATTSIPFRSVVHPEKPSDIWGVVSKPYPTGAFWTNFAVAAGNGPVAVYPYGVKAIETGVQLSYGPTRRYVTQDVISDPFTCDLEISAQQSYLSRSIVSYDNASVTMEYKLASNAKMRIPFVKGSPFITVFYENAVPVIRADTISISNVEARFVRDQTTTQYIVTLGNYQKWLIYSNESILFSWKANTLVASSPVNRAFIRIAILPAKNVETSYNSLMQYVNCIPLSVAVSSTPTSANIMQIWFKYSTTGTGQLLMFALPHHVNIMKVPDIHIDEIRKVNSNLSPIYSIKGKMQAVLGNQWIIEYSLPTIGWNYIPYDPLSTAQLDEIASNLILDVQTKKPAADDIYSFAKQLGRMSRLALIADELGIADCRSHALQSIETALTPWLLGQNINALVYDKTWGGVVPSSGLTDSGRDFGSGWYSDHHFHYGYFVYTFATLARLDPAYHEVHKNAIEAIVKDICNIDPSNTDFPFVRHKDFFDGHSWASGLFLQANAKGQESSSEAVSAYYAVHLYGIATSNTELTKFAHLLLSMEVHAAKTYWHMSDDGIYDPIFAANTMVGNLGALDTSANTWFGAKIEYVHGINIMPLTPATALLLDQPYVMKEWPVLNDRLATWKASFALFDNSCSAHPACARLNLMGRCCPAQDLTMLSCCNSTYVNNAIDEEWLGYIFVDHAVVDREASWLEILSARGFGEGGSRTNALFWAATRPPKPFNYSVGKGVDFAAAVRPQCEKNSACDAAGLIGTCCPVDGTNTFLGCCPKIQP